MAKLFNNIRKKLISDKPSTTRNANYLKYAIGEIILVVIGILIALQINTWNEGRINNKRSIGYMKSLVEDLKSDIIQYNISIESYTTDINNNKKLFINDDYKMLDVDSINDLVKAYYMSNRISIQTYEKIKNVGLAESLGSESMNDAINDYYNVQINYYETLLQWDKESTTKDVNFWFYNNNFEASSIRHYDSIPLLYIASKVKRKNDLIKLVESTQGRNHLRGAIGRHEHTLKRVKEFKVIAENLVKMINKELNN